MLYIYKLCLFITRILCIPAPGPRKKNTLSMSVILIRSRNTVPRSWLLKMLEVFRGFSDPEHGVLSLNERKASYYSSDAIVLILLNPDIGAEKISSGFRPKEVDPKTAGFPGFLYPTSEATSDGFSKTSTALQRAARQALQRAQAQRRQMFSWVLPVWVTLSPPKTRPKKGITNKALQTMCCT